MGLSADSEGFSDVGDVVELGIVAIKEDVEANVEGLGPAPPTAPEFEDDVVCGDEAANVDGFGPIAITSPNS